MFKLPIKSNIKPTITQGYANTSLNDWYAKNGIQSPFHNGIDIVTGDHIKTYGRELVCPFKDGLISRIDWDTPMSTKGNGVFISSQINEDTMLQIGFWHTGKINVTIGQQVKEGDVVCYIGNSGLCSPRPTEYAPFNGSHLHFLCAEYKLINKVWVLQNADNGVNGWIDASKYFDMNDWYKTDKDSEAIHDVAPLHWAFEKLGLTDNFSKLIYMLKYIFK